MLIPKSKKKKVTNWWNDAVLALGQKKNGQHKTRFNVHNGFEIFRHTGVPIGVRVRTSQRMFEPDEYLRAYMYVLTNCDEVDPYVE